MDNQLIQQLVKARETLKDKYKTLKPDILKSQSHLERTYHPITRPLKQLIESMKKAEPILKSMSTPKSEFHNKSSVHRLSKAEDIEELTPKMEKKLHSITEYVRNCISNRKC